MDVTNEASLLQYQLSWSVSLLLAGLGLVVVVAAVCHCEREDEKERPEIDRSFLKSVCRTGSESRVGHTRTEGRAKTFLLGTLHEDDENEQK